ncbi:MAG: hypothetical protein KTR31_20980 [Myxococcales bacterium]|nr:hypothetical protein [Myxococcales bacterium]
MATSTALAQPVVVEVVQTDDGGWQLVRGGEPYVVRGGGYSGSLQALAEAGGNSVRTWGVGEDTQQLLDDAHALGLTVALGLWLGHVEHGFDYSDAAAVEAQLAEVRRQVQRFEDHPALLLWGVGNEVELEGGDDPRLWAAIEQVAAMVKEEDPAHPTMAVTADLGKANEQRLSELCPSIDVWGINTYGGVSSLSERLTERGFSGAFLLTEYGPPGDWEVPRTPWGAPLEATSTRKVSGYEAALDVIRDDPRALGGFAFLWGPAEQPRDTWYALFGPPLSAAGRRLRFGGVDALQARWTGQPPPDRAPEVAELRTEVAGAVVETGSPLAATLEATDPEGQPLTVDWLLHVDGGVGRPGLGASGGGVVRCEPDAGASVAWTAPEVPGPYRLLAMVRDPAGGAGFASARFHVGVPPEPDAEGEEGPLRLPLAVDGPFEPSGWMGDAVVPDGLVMGDCGPRPGICQGVCRHFLFQPRNEAWAGVIWHHPSGNWEGEKPGVPIAKGPAVVTFTAWGDEGGERVTFVVGNRKADGFEVKREVVLTDSPRTYTIPVPRRRHRDVTYGFGWVTSTSWGGKVGFSVADVQWVRRP